MNLYFFSSSSSSSCSYEICIKERIIFLFTSKISMAKIISEDPLQYAHFKLDSTPLAIIHSYNVAEANNNNNNENGEVIKLKQRNVTFQGCRKQDANFLPSKRNTRSLIANTLI